MTKQTGILIVFLLFLAVLFGFFTHTRTGVEPADGTVSVSNENDQAVRTLVEGFGRTLQRVSLLAPDAVEQIALHYSPYVSPELLEAWQRDPLSAPGRQTSSPWPDSIEVVSISQEGSVYVVEANLLEVAGVGDPVGVRAVDVRVERWGDTFLITAFTLGSYTELPKRQTVIGYWECLPHKDTTGPQTMECAFGIAIDQSDGHYAVDTSLMSTYPVDYSTGTKVKIEGIITPAEALSSIQKYDIDGIIRATSIVKI